MAQRVIAPELQALYDKGAKVYSYSKLGSIHDCAYGAYLTYIEKSPQAQNVYSYLGGIAHDVLENIVEGKQTKDDIKPAIQNGLDELEMIGLDFPKLKDGSDGIKKKWTENMMCMARDWVSPKGKYLVEKLLLLKLNDNRYLQGYADLIRVLPDGSLQVLDIKTSSQFQDKDLLHYGRQLVAYTMALEQAGYKCQTPMWIMIKYVSVSYMTKRRKTDKEEECVTKVCDRCKLAQTIKVVTKKKMIAAGYDEDTIGSILETFSESNDINDLPSDIASQFSIVTYTRPYPVNDELRQECIDYINETADEFEYMQESGKWSAKQVGDKNGNPDFFCTNLCGHRKTCKYLKDCIDKKTFYSTNSNDIDDLF